MRPGKGLRAGDPAEMVAARVAHIVTYLSVTVCALSIAPLLVGSWTYGIWPFVPVWCLAVVLATATCLAVSFGLFLPLTFCIGVLVTFRIAGPVYRFEQYLKQVSRGEQLGPCKIRDGDEFQGLCDLINEATRHLREAPAEEQPVAESTHESTPESTGMAAA